MEKCSWDESWSSPGLPKPLNEDVFPCDPFALRGWPGDAKEECRDPDGGWQTRVSHTVSSVSKRLFHGGVHWDHGHACRGDAFPSGTALWLLGWAMSGMSGECGGCGAPHGVT